MKKRRKRTQEELDDIAFEFMERLDWIESAWGVTTKGEVDLSTGRAWFVITKPGETSGISVECDAEDFRITDSSPT